MKSDTFAQGERPDEPITRRGPAGSQPGLDVRAPFAPDDERVEDVPGDQRDRPLERGAGIEDRRSARRADPYLAANSRRWNHSLRRRERGRGHDQDRHSDQERHKDRHDWGQNGSDATQGPRSHRSLYTWNPLFMPLVSRVGIDAKQVRKLLMHGRWVALEGGPRGNGANRWRKTQ